jgi:hypothetical protein
MLPQLTDGQADEKTVKQILAALLDVDVEHALAQLQHVNIQSKCK